MLEKGISLGGVASDWKFRDQPAETFKEYLNGWTGLDKALGGYGIELQAGFNIPNLKKLPGRLHLEPRHPFVGVHQASRGDPTDFDKRLVRKIGKNVKAVKSYFDVLSSMRLAHSVKANYLVLHPVEKVRPGEDRKITAKKAKDFIRNVIFLKDKLGHKYRLCFELLESPAFPSNIEEISELLSDVKKKNPLENIGVIIDIPHHWHNSLHKEAETPGSPLVMNTDYYDHLKNDLSTLIKCYGKNVIEGFHLAQAYVSPDEEVVTHGLPGLTKGEKLANYTPLSFDKHPGIGTWLDVKKTLEVISDLMKEESVENIKIVLESFYPAPVVTESLKILNGLVRKD